MSMKKAFKFMALSSMVLTLAACGSTNAEETATPEIIKFGVTGIEGLEQLQTEFGPFKEELEGILGKEVEFFALANNTSATTALEYEQVDILLAGGTEYVMLKDMDENIHAISELTRPGYLPVILSHKDSGIESEADMKGKTIGTRDVGSTSGYLMPLKMIQDAGIDLEKDLEVLELGKANEGAFLAGEIDLLPTTLLNYEELKEEEGIDFNIVMQGEALPNDLLVGGAHLDEAYVEEIRDLIVANSDDLIAALLESEENDKFSESDFVEAKDAHYEELRNAFKELGVEYN